MSILLKLLFCWFIRDNWSFISTYSDRRCWIWYINSSKMKNTTGISVYCSTENINYTTSLSNFSIVFKAEVYAILICYKSAHKNCKNSLEVWTDIHLLEFYHITVIFLIDTSFCWLDWKSLILVKTTRKDWKRYPYTVLLK